MSGSAMASSADSSEGFGDWGREKTPAPPTVTRGVDARSSAQQTGMGAKQPCVSMLADFSNCVTRMENSLEVYGTPQDTPSFRNEMSASRERCKAAVQELDKAFRQRGHPSQHDEHDAYDTRCQHAVFAALVDRWHQIGTRTLSAERQHPLLASSFIDGTSSFIGGSSLTDSFNQGGAMVISHACSGAMEHQSLQAQLVQRVDIDGQIHEEAMNDLQYYDGQMCDIRDMMLDLNIQVESDQADLSKISERIERTSMNIEEVVDQLEKCEEINRSISRKRCCCYVTIVLIVLAAIGVLVYIFFGSR